MWVWMVIVCVFLGVLSLLLHSNIFIRVKFQRKGQDDRIDFDISAIYGLIRHRMDIPFIDVSDPISGAQIHMEQINEKKHKVTSEKDNRVDAKTLMQKLEQANRLLQHFFGFSSWAIQTLSGVTCIKLQWSSKIGLSDAALTGISIGAAWSLKSFVVGWLTHMMEFQVEPKLSIEASFHQSCFSTSGICIVKIRVWRAVFAMIRFLMRIIKMNGGISMWKSVLLKRK